MDAIVVVIVMVAVVARLSAPEYTRNLSLSLYHSIEFIRKQHTNNVLVHAIGKKIKQRSSTLTHIHVGDADDDTPSMQIG